MKQIAWLFICWACLTEVARAQTLVEKIDALLASESILKTSEAGIAIYDLTADKPVYTYQAEKLYRPASIEKVITSVTALAQLGKDYRYKTRLSYTGTIIDGVLEGDLYVVGGFDPEFMESDMQLLADTIQFSGIRQIKGKLIGDVSLMDSVYWGNGWSWDDTPEAFQPYLSPLMLNRGCVDVMVSPGAVGEPGNVVASPESDYYEIKNHSLTKVSHAGKLKVTRNWLENGNTLLVSGNVVASRKRTLNLYNPQRYFMQTFRYVLHKNGIEIPSDSLVFGKVPEKAAPLCLCIRPLETVLNRTLKESDNLAAESMFYHLGGHYARRSEGISSEDGQKAIYEFMDNYIGYPSRSYKIVDGSGVSLYNYVSPDLVLAYLKYAYRHPDIYDSFYNGLPVAGIDGTLEHRMKKSKACRKVRAKTGTVTGISSLAGYAESQSGHIYAFVIINQNVLRAGQARNFQDKICEILVTDDAYDRINEKRYEFE